MNEKLKALYEKISGDASLMEAFQKGLEAISDDDAKKSFIIDFAKEQGVTLAMEDFPKTAVMEDLSDDELENVAGGAYGDYIKDQCGDGALAACTIAMGMAGFCDC